MSEESTKGAEKTELDGAFDFSYYPQAATKRKITRYKICGIVKC